MPDYVPIQDLTIKTELADTDYIPVSDGSTAYAVHPPTFVANILDDTLSESGKAADAAVTGQLKGEYNLWNPSATYTQTNKAGTSKSGYTINSDGSLTCTRSNGGYGALFLVDESRTLPAGTYTISGRMTLTATASTSVKAALAIGRTVSTSLVTMTTERGGSTSISAGDLQGWFEATFTLTDSETFAFMCIPNGSNMVSATYPCTIDYLMITNSSALTDYDSSIYTAMDKVARADLTILPTLQNAVKANKAEVIFQNEGRLTVDLSSRTISSANGMYIFTDGGRTLISASAIAEQLTSTYATYDSDTGVVTISIPNYYVLVYRESEATLMVVHYTAISTTDIILYGEYFHNNYGILWDKFWRDTVVDGDLEAEIFNAEPYSGTYDWQTPVVAYGALFKGKSNVESFAFFTDPHCMGSDDATRNEANMKEYVKKVQTTYNMTPCSFIVSGGDWLNNSTTMDEACYRLGLIKGFHKNMFKDSYIVLGNHDTNYQGKLDSDSENYTGRLTDATIASIMFRDTDTKKAYYSFDGLNSKCYVLDTGIEHSTMLDYDWEQIAWLAGKLIEDDPAHAIIFLHKILNSGEVQTNATNFGTLVEAYNAHTTVTLNSVTYDFTSCTGHVDFWVAGHTHSDSTGTLGGIPYIITARTSDSTPLIDLFLVDYDNGTVTTVRVGGTGSDRSFTI